MVLPGVGFFGCGTLAQVLIGYLQDQGFKIMAIWAPRLEDAQKISQLLNIPVYSTVIDKVLLMPNVQLIFTACAPHFHNQIATKACGIGKHVVCDWPPSHCIKDSILMRNAATNYPSLITLYLNGLRFVPTFNIMKKFLQEDNFLGDIRLINATIMCDVVSISNEKSIYWDYHMGGGLLSLYGTNLIDIITYMTGYRAQRVHGIVHCVKQLHQKQILYNPTEDFVSFQMELVPFNNAANKNHKQQQKKIMKDGPIIANVSLNGHHYNMQPKHEIYIYGTKGYLVCRDGDIYSYKNDNESSNASKKSMDIDNDGFSDSKSEKQSTQKHEKLIFILEERDYQWRVSPSTKLLQDSYVYPKIYLSGIRNLIQALKSAFYGNQIQSTLPPPPQDVSNKLNSTHLSNGSIKKKPNSLNGNNDEQHKSNTTTLENLLKEEHEQQQQQQQMVHWIKDPVMHATNFDDGIYLQTVIDAIRMSSEHREWIRIPTD